MSPAYPPTNTGFARSALAAVLLCLCCVTAAQGMTIVCWYDGDGESTGADSCQTGSPLRPCESEICEAGARGSCQASGSYAHYVIVGEEQCPASYSSEDAQATDPAARLTAALGGTVWTYHYQGATFDFTFGAGGQIEGLDAWSGVIWRADDAETVTFEAPGGARMALHFESDSRFKTTDWHGETAWGERAQE